MWNGFFVRPNPAFNHAHHFSSQKSTMYPLPIYGLLMTYTKTGLPLEADV